MLQSGLISQHRQTHDKIVIISICAVISGADTWPDIYEYGLLTILQSPDGIPSADTFRRVFMLIDKDEPENSFIRWVTSM